MFRIARARRKPASIKTASAPLPRPLFDENAYLNSNADAVRAIADGTAASAYDHYLRAGHGEELRGLRPRSLPLASAPIGGRDHPRDAVIDRLIDLEIEKRTLLAMWDAYRPDIPEISFAMLSEDVDDALAPPLDRAACDEALLDEDQRAWRRDGYLIKRQFLPDELIDRYCALREGHPSRNGWTNPVPYMHFAEIRDLALYPPLMTLLGRLVGEEMGLHLNLTGWITTDRSWHQDDYLNPPSINSWYAAVWMALDDIHPNAGPFEFIAGSHRWPLLRKNRVCLYLPAEERVQEAWPSHAERFVTKAVADEIARRGAPTERFLARKGDVLVWHGRLMHRGSAALDPNLDRKALISHYSGLSHRYDMPDIGRTPSGQAYFIHHRPLDWAPEQA